MTRSQPARSRKDTAKRQRRHLQGVEMVGRGVLREVQQPASQRETKVEKFLRIAPRRLANALNAMELLKQLADPEFYECSEEHREIMLRELTAKVYDIRECFLSRGKVRVRNVFADTADNLDALGTEAGLLNDLKDVL